MNVLSFFYRFTVHCLIYGSYAKRALLVPEKLNAGRELKHTRVASHQLIQQW